MYIPFHYDPNKKYPLLLNRHGAGNRGSDKKLQHDAWNYGFNTPEIFRWLFSQQKGSDLLKPLQFPKIVL
jgi:predicted peptidase